MSSIDAPPDPEQYVTVAELRQKSVMPPEDFDFINGQDPAFVLEALLEANARVDSLLRKRYPVPFEKGKVPELVRGWVVKIVTPVLYQRRGYNDSDSSLAASVFKKADDAEAEITLCADGKDSRYDLTLRNNTKQTGIVAPVCLVYSEHSPYHWRTLQRRAGRIEDHMR